MKRFQGKHLFLAGLLVFLPSAVYSQPSHVEQLRDAAVACLGTTLADIQSFTLVADERAPYLRSSLVARWLNERREVYESDSLRTDRELPAFRYHVDDVQITLRRIGSGRVERIARVALRYTLLGPGKQILADSMCDEQIVDTIAEDRVRTLADPRFAETNVRLEYESLFKRILEPAVIVGAAVVGTYLFFNLRSKRTNDG